MWASYRKRGSAKVGLLPSFVREFDGKTKFTGNQRRFHQVKMGFINLDVKAWLLPNKLIFCLIFMRKRFNTFQIFSVLPSTFRDRITDEDLCRQVQEQVGGNFRKNWKRLSSNDSGKILILQHEKLHPSWIVSCHLGIVCNHFNCLLNFMVLKRL